MSAPRLRKVDSREKLETLVDDFMTQGFEIIEQGERTAMLRKKSWGKIGGHLICLLLTVWFSFGIGNLIYAIASHYTAEKILIKIE